MRIISKKSERVRKIAIGIIIILLAFYVITIIAQIITGYEKLLDTVWNFIFFFSFCAFVVIVFPPNHFEFTEEKLFFRPSADYRRRTVLLKDIDYIYYQSNMILMETKAEKKYEINLLNFSKEEIEQIKTKFIELGVRELQD